jgi:hypothetical protein
MIPIMDVTGVFRPFAYVGRFGVGLFRLVSYIWIGKKPSNAHRFALAWEHERRVVYLPGYS